MKIRRFFARDMRTALADVSKELGADAAIVSSRRVSGGIELMAAIDYDESDLAQTRSTQSSFESPNDSPVGAVDRLNNSSAAAVSDWSGKKSLNPSEKPAPNKFIADKSTPKSIHNKAMVNPPILPADSNRHFSSTQESAVKLSGVDMREDDSFGIGVSKQERSTLQIEFGKDPGLQGLRDELRQMRSLVEEQLHGFAWKDMQQRQPVHAWLSRTLSLLQLSPKLREQYAGAIGKDANAAYAQALARIAGDVVIGRDDILNQGGMYSLVGPTGVGKTTSVAKLAARFALQHGAHTVALVSTDGFRIGAHDQLRTYARLIGCAFRCVDSPEQLAGTLDSVIDKRLVLIDSAGMSQRDERLQAALAVLDARGYASKRILVLSATAQRSLLLDCAKQFQSPTMAGVILTKLDEATSLGAALSLLIESRLPLLFCCDGQQVPEDMRVLRGPALVAKARHLAEQFQDNVDEWQLAQELLSHEQTATSQGGISRAGLAQRGAAHAGL